MRRGVSFVSLPNPPLEPSLEFSELLGLPIRYNPTCNRIAKACGFWPFKCLEVGPDWFLLPHGERMAVLMHEAGHAIKWHAERRVILIPVFWTRFAVNIVKRQELEADAFAVSKGYGVQLLRFLTRFRGCEPGEHYPNYFVRARQIQSLLGAAR